MRVRLKVIWNFKISSFLLKICYSLKDMVMIKIWVALIEENLHLSSRISHMTAALSMLSRYLVGNISFEQQKQQQQLAPSNAAGWNTLGSVIAVLLITIFSEVRERYVI